MEKTQYIPDHDLHIHTHLSLCSNDPEQNNKRILEYAKKSGLRHICITDHYWDETVPGASGWYSIQDTKHITSDLPLPEDPDGKVSIHFGCETEKDKFGTVGLSDKALESLEWIIIPTTHLHMNGFTIDEKDFSLERRADLWVERFSHLLDLDLPFYKTGIAHLTCDLMANKNPEDHITVLDMIDDSVMEELFTRTAKLGAGVELNFDFSGYDEKTIEHILRPYRIAKSCGCGLYFGSDAHHPQDLANAPHNFILIRDALGLTEGNILRPFR